MRVKTSVTLSSTLLEEIDSLDDNRSAFLERAVRIYLGQLSKSRRDSNDAAILARRADGLNKEAADVLAYQGIPE